MQTKPKDETRERVSPVILTVHAYPTLLGQHIYFSVSDLSWRDGMLLGFPFSLPSSSYFFLFFFLLFYSFLLFFYTSLPLLDSPFFQVRIKINWKGNSAAPGFSCLCIIISPIQPMFSPLLHNLWGINIGCFVMMLYPAFTVVLLAWNILHMVLLTYMTLCWIFQGLLGKCAGNAASPKN